jgi:quinohemoprotein amine dehydrogenase
MRRQEVETMMRATSGAALALALASALPAAASEALLTQACGGCHEAGPDGLSRIAGQRKTPEGWLMTIVRMRQFHGIELSAADQGLLVAHLSETHGLAPAETAGWRYALEKDPNVIEAIAPPLDQMCARCHTGARVMLQRRTAEEWRLHIDFHVGQFPTVEYQALGRDRDWYRIAATEIAPMLAETLPLDSAAWEAWKAAPKKAPTGGWVVLTELPGKGAAWGTLDVAGSGPPYDVTGALTLADGSTLPAKGRLNLYTGYEWRANLLIGNEEYRQVLAMSEDGDGIEGRQFLADRDSLGARLVGAREDGRTQILGAVPSVAPAGADTAVQVVGVEIEALDVEGAEIVKLAPNPFGAVLTLKAGANAVAEIAAGEQAATVAFYTGVDRLTVEPPFTIARVGGGSDYGPEAVPAAFKAVGWWNGPDGQPETADDIRVGALPAAWSTGNWDEIAAAMEDAKHAGVIDAAGIFSPGVAGPNPARPFTTNNAGDIKVTGAAAGLTADARLIVTVQRFVDPPIR